MKKIGFIVAALFMSVAVSYAERPSLSHEPFIVSTGKLASYLKLTPSQIAEVAEINAYFIEKQDECWRTCAKKQDQKRFEAVYGNLKLMKQALNPEQYRKYVTLLNITNNNNNQSFTRQALPDVYLAEK